MSKKKGARNKSVTARESIPEGPIVYPDLAEAYVGMIYRFGMLDPIVCYDMDRVLEIYMADGSSEEEAIEHFEYNVIGTWAGDGTPCFLKTGVDPEDYVDGWGEA